MTGNTTQATLDAIDLMRGMEGDRAAAVRARFYATIRSIFFFAAGCAVAAVLYAGLASGALHFQSQWAPQVPP
jgi:uncharacterized membrane protein YoaK (UPF0700 family)